MIQAILKRVVKTTSQAERRDILHNKYMLDLLLTIRDINTSLMPSVRPRGIRDVALFHTMRLLIEAIPESARDSAIQEIKAVLPDLYGMLRLPYLAGVESRAQAERRRINADKKYK